VLPRVTPQNEHFWKGGAQGELRILRCRSCRAWIHPPQPRCPACLGKDLAPEVTSGRATVATYTVNHQAWLPGASEPYAIAIVELEDDPRVRLTTNVVGCAPGEVRIGMPVRAVFEQHEDVWIPLFEPRAV
jgi:uncharacterized OB-fold protein